MAKETKNAEELQKTVSDSVVAAIVAASGNLGGTSFESIDKALESAAKDDPFFNPTLAQYREGMIISTDSSFAKIRKVPVGRGNNEAWCITGAVGRRKADGTIEFTGAFNMYPSTLRKQIPVTDENGDQVLNEKKEPMIIDGAGNPVWEAARACQGPEELLKYAMDKTFEVSAIKRDFGPAVFVDQLDGSRKATSHRLTSLPLFNLI